MKPAPFELCTPRSLGETVIMLRQGGEDAKVLAGGQLFGCHFSGLPLAPERVWEEIQRQREKGTQR